MAEPDTPLVTRLLLALFAPGSVEGEVCRVQDALFARHGLVSSIALVPLIPVLFVPASARDLPLGRLCKSLPAGCRFSTTGLQWVEGGLYLAVESGGAWGALREEARRLCGPGEPPLFAETEGFCLGCWEALPPQRALMTVQVPTLRFSSCTFALASLTARTAEQTWWREVSLETLSEKPLRCRRAAAPPPGSAGGSPEGRDLSRHH
jgi:hypothetical protein